MIFREYALDPTALDSWDVFKDITNRFGFEHGRLISRFPEKWEKEVLKACGDLGDVEKKKIALRLRQFGRQKLVDFDRAFNSKVTWLNNALEEHKRQPFQAIIANDSKAKRKHIISPTNVEETHPLIRIGRGGEIQRRAEELAGCCQLLLEASTEVILVDPYFDPSRRKWTRPLGHFLMCAEKGKTLSRFEYHLKAHAEGSWFSDECERQFSKNLSEHSEVRFLLWEDEEDPLDLHSRLVLTDVGVMKIDRGLDEDHDGNTLVTVLNDVEREDLWDRYAKRQNKYDLIDEIVVTQRGAKVVKGKRKQKK